MPKVIVLTTKVPPRPHPLARCGQQFDICSSYYQVPIDVTAGWAASPGLHLCSWVDWSNVHVQVHTKAKAKLTAAITQLFPPSDNTEMSGTTQTLEPCVVNPGLSNLQENGPGPTDRGHRT